VEDAPTRLVVSPQGERGLRVDSCGSSISNRVTVGEIP
jgi:hypothetical protein